MKEKVQVQVLALVLALVPDQAWGSSQRRRVCMVASHQRVNAGPSLVLVLLALVLVAPALVLVLVLVLVPVPDQVWRSSLQHPVCTAASLRPAVADQRLKVEVLVLALALALALALVPDQGWR